MSTSYSASITVGIVAGARELLSSFKAERPEKSHMEDRFHPKTGKRLDPVKVVDQEACKGWELGQGDDRRFYEEDAVEDALDHLCEEILDCGWGWRFDGILADEFSDEDDGTPEGDRTVVLTYRDHRELQLDDGREDYLLEIGASVDLRKAGPLVERLEKLAEEVARKTRANPSGPLAVCCGSGG